VRYWLLAAVSALSAFAVAAIVGAALARLAGVLLARRVDRTAVLTRAQLLFAIRVLPMAAAATAAFAIALPIFLWFEERNTVEPLNRTLLVAACAGVFLLGRGLWRAAASWRASAQFVRAWQGCGRPVGGLTARMPVFAVDDAFPTVAVAGVLRPRLFIAERVLREFSAAEVAAMVAHECAHVSAYDNVKRLLMRACPDVLDAAPLERAWAAACEEAADARAAALHPSARLDLAQALVRVARLAAPSAPELASAFYLGGSIEHRVRRLIDPAPAAAPSRSLRVALPLAVAVFAGAVVLAAPSLHALMEQAVRALP
jgi:hypothetical protein